MGIVDACFEIISKKLVKSSAEFRYAILSYENFSAKMHLSYLTLEKIANLLINIYHEVNSQKENNTGSKPIVLCIFNKKKKSYYVLGTHGNNESSFNSLFKKK